MSTVKRLTRLPESCRASCLGNRRMMTTGRTSPDTPRSPCKPVKSDGSYDDHQIEARDFTCPACGHRYFQTTVHGPREKCLICQPWDYTKDARDRDGHSAIS